MVTAAASSQSFVALHLWHLIGGVVFLVVGLGVAALADRRQPVRNGRGHGARTRAADPGRGGEPGLREARRTARSVTQGPASRAWLTLCVVGSVGAAAVHLVVMPEHFGESLLYGAFFAVLATCQLAWSAAVAIRPSRRLLLAGAAADAAVLGLWLMTRLVAIPLGPAAGTVEQFGGLDVLASGLELAVVVTAVRLLWRPRLPARQPLPLLLRSPLLLGGLALAAGLVTVTALVAPPS